MLDGLKASPAGDPRNEALIWTTMTPQELADRLKENPGISRSTFVMRKVLLEIPYRRRKAPKQKPRKQVAHREEQVEHIAHLKQASEAEGNPILSLDPQKKEALGDSSREGSLEVREGLPPFDQDFQSLAEGIVIPYGIYDLPQNLGYLTLGTRKDTSEVAWDCIRTWGPTLGKTLYPTSTARLGLWDGGGSTGSRSILFKADLQKLVKEGGYRFEAPSILPTGPPTLRLSIGFFLP